MEIAFPPLLNYHVRHSPCRQSPLDRQAHYPFWVQPADPAQQALRPPAADHSLHPGRVAISSRRKEELTVQTRGSLFNWSYLRRLVLQPTPSVGFLGTRWRPFGPWRAFRAVFGALRALSSLVHTLVGPGWDSAGAGQEGRMQGAACPPKLPRGPWKAARRTKWPGSVARHAVPQGLIGSFQGRGFRCLLFQYRKRLPWRNCRRVPFRRRPITK